VAADSDRRIADPPDAHKDIPAFPFCHVTVRGRKPREDYPEKPRTLGEHLKKRRLDLGLRQRDTAERLGVTKNSYENWEHDKHEPEFRYWPEIIAFLGYDPGVSPSLSGEESRPHARSKGSLSGSLPGASGSTLQPSPRGRAGR